MNLKDQLAAAVKAANDLVAGVKAANREFTAEEQANLKSVMANIKDLKEKIAAADESESLLSELGAVTADQAKSVTPSGAKSEQDVQAKSIGGHFIKSVGDKITNFKGVRGASLTAPEFKAAGDTIVTGGTGDGAALAPYLTQLDQTIVKTPRRPSLADLFTWGSMSAPAITYLIEGIVEGAFTTVAEGGAKPQLSFAKPTMKTDAASKIAGYIKLSDEMLEDLAFIKSEIDDRLLYELLMFEESQLLNGDGLGTNLLGLLNREGVLTETSAAEADNADALFRARTKIQIATSRAADGIVINPLDYQALRLKQDANGQYYGGGFFQGQYGGGDPLAWEPPIWGMRTVVSAGVAQGTALVGAFAGGAATPYRKGGIRVEATNSHASDFTSNLVTIRAEERIALAVRYPSAFAKVTLATATAPAA